MGGLLATLSFYEAAGFHQGNKTYFEVRRLLDRLGRKRPTHRLAGCPLFRINVPKPPTLEARRDIAGEIRQNICGQSLALPFGQLAGRRFTDPI
jgi:hypothetical protein